MHVLRPRRVCREQPQQSGKRLRASWSRAARRGVAGAVAAAMVATLAPAPVWAADEDGEPADEDGAQGSAGGGHGPANAPRSGAAAGGRSQGEPDGPPNVGFGADRGKFTEGICAVGDTMWVAIRHRSKLQAYDRSTGERDEDSDLSIEEPARGVWCDGETLWYTTRNDHSKIFAYDMATGARDEDREFDISALDFSHGGLAWAGPLGIASDGDTMWVATNSRVVGNRLYALDMSTKAPKPELDIITTSRTRFYPKGLFSDGEFLWVASSVSSTVQAYDISTLARVESAELEITDHRSGGNWGLWSDGEHMWVCDFRNTTLRAYPMPHTYGPRLDTLEVSGVQLVSLSSREYRGRVARGTASVTVNAVAADDDDTVTFGTVDADDVAEGHQWSLELGDNTLEITVSDGTTSRTYTVTVTRVDLDALSDDATLSSLSVDGAEVEGFASDVGGYRLRVANDVASVTVEAAATDAAAQVTITPADADPGTDGHQVPLAVGSNLVTVAVAATDGVATAAYTLTIGRKPSVFGYDGFLDISGLEHRRSMDIWAGARTRWVSYNRSGDEAVLAYDPSTGQRAPGRDIAALADGNDSPWALWSDGEGLYVLDAWKSMVFQYSLDEDGADGFGAHAATVSLEGIGEDDARGLWSDGETMWVADVDDAKVYAYELDGDRVSSEDFDTLAAAGNSMPMDLWSDGQVMWVLDKGDRKIYAYDLDSKARLEHLDFETLHRGNGWPSGLWSNGVHMWVSDADDTRAYAYLMPAVLGLDTVEVSGVNLARSTSTEFWGRVPRGTATVTVTAVPADDAHTVTFGTDDADDDAEGHQWSLELGDNTLEVAVSDGTDSLTYTVVVTRVDADMLTDDATLSSLAVEGAEVDGLAADVHRYRVRVGHDVASATVAAAATETAAQVTITPADADPDTEGHQVALDVGSNPVTFAVAATDGITEAAYTLTISRRGDPDQPPNVGFGADRWKFTEGICAVGDTMWVAIRHRSRLQAYDRSTGERDEDSDLSIEEPARGVWCDGETLWYTTRNDHSKIFAYDMATGARDEDREFDISALDFSHGGLAWAGPLGIASDGDTMWVATNSRVVGNRLYALDMSTKAPKPELDIITTSRTRFYPKGLFSDGEFLWVASSVSSTVQAYDISTLARVESAELEITDHRSGGNWGLWSDGEHMWVCDFRNTTLRAYPMPEAYGVRLETLEVSGAVLVRFRGRVARGTASVTVTAEPADGAHTVTFGTDDADPDTEGHQWSLALGDNTLEVTVSDGTHSRVYTVIVVRVDVDMLSDDATLSSLTVDGAAVVGFASDVHDYALRVTNDVVSATVAATATEAAARVTITPADADPVAEGHQVALAVGSNVVTVAVAATDGLATAAYTLTVSRMPSAFGYDGFADISGLAHRHSMDIWADAQTRWVSYDRPGDEAVLAYDPSTGERAPGRDIAARAAGNESPQALWSGGASLYVLDTWKSMVFRYRLSDDDLDGFGAHLATVSLEGMGRDDARGLWSDGEHMWVANREDAKVYAYDLESWDRVSGEDFDTLAAAGNSMPVDLWSDGQVMWVLDKGDRKIYAYDLHSKARLEHLDFETLQRGNGWPSGLWSDGAHMWVSDADDTRAYAYVMPAMLALDTLEVSGVELVRSSWREWRGHVARGTATVTVAAEPADSTHTVTFGTVDADPDTEGHQWSLVLGDNTLEVTVSDGADSHTYTVTVVRVDVDALSDDATLSSLSVDGAGVDGFASDVHSYRVEVAHDVVSVTVAATATVAAAQVAITPADADPDTEGHQVSLAPGANPARVAVAATDGVATAVYTLEIHRELPAEDVDGFGEKGRRLAYLWSNGSTIWVSEPKQDAIEAYELASGRSRGNERIGGLGAADNDWARGIWSNGDTIWVADYEDNKLYAYGLDSGARRPELDIDTLEAAGNTSPRGIWSNGDTMWVVDTSDRKLYAYELDGGARMPGSDIDTLGAAGNASPRDVWSDGDTIWVADSSDAKLYAYTLNGGARRAELDFDTLEAAGNANPRGIWSNGDIMWVSDPGDDKLYAYNMPARTDTQQQDSTQQQSQQDEPLQTLQAQQDEQAQQAQQDEQAQQDDPQQQAQQAQQDEQAQQDDPQQAQQDEQSQQQAQQAQQDDPQQDDPQQAQQDDPQQAQQDEQSQQQAQQAQQDDPQQDDPQQAQQDEQSQQQDGTQQDDPQQGGTQQQSQQQDGTQQQVQQDEQDEQDEQAQQNEQSQQQVQQDEPQQDKVQQAPAPNIPATGVPVVAGAVRVGETLVVDVSGIADADGLVNVSFTYLWLADGVAVAGAAGAAYTLVEADVGKVFGVRVSFVDDRGHGESLASAAAGPVLGIGPPGAPRGLVVTAGDREVTLSWEPPADNGNAPVRKYRIEWRIGGRDYDESHLGITRDTTYTKTHLANGVEYIFWVSAENGSGYSLGPHGPASEEVSATPSSGSVMDLATPVLSGPETLHFGMVKLHWDDIDGADRYMVQHYNLDDANWQDLPTAGIDIAVHGSSAVVTNLNQGIWWLRVGAASCTATSEWSEIEALYITDAPDWHDVPIPPVEPGDETEPCPEVLATPVLSAPETLHYGMVKLDWDDIDGADRYTVQHYNLDDANWQDLPTAGIDIALHGSSAVVTNLSQGIWWLRVGAASCTATSEWSEIEAFYILDATDWQNVPTPAIEPGDQPQPCP